MHKCLVGYCVKVCVCMNEISWWLTPSFHPAFKSTDFLSSKLYEREIYGPVRQRRRQSLNVKAVVIALGFFLLR